MIYLEALSCYRPSTLIPLSELEEFARLPCPVRSMLRNTFGFRTIAVERELRVHEMLVRAGQLLLDRHPHVGRRIDLILTTHTFNLFAPYLIDPLPGFRSRNGLPSVPVLSVSQMNCASIDLMFRVAAQWLLHDTDLRGILLLAGDKMFIPGSRYLRESSMSADAAAAAFVGREPAGGRMLYTALKADASLFNGSESPEEDYQWFQKTFVMGLSKIVKTALERCELSLEQLSYIFPSNINAKALLRLSQILQLPVGFLFYPTLEEIGHAHNADPLLNMEAALSGSRIRHGDRYATLTAGMGGTYGCTVFQHVEH